MEYKERRNFNRTECDVCGNRGPCHWCGRDGHKRNENSEKRDTVLIFDFSKNPTRIITNLPNMLNTAIVSE